MSNVQIILEEQWVFHSNHNLYSLLFFYCMKKALKSNCGNKFTVLNSHFIFLAIHPHFIKP